MKKFNEKFNPSGLNLNLIGLMSYEIYLMNKK